MSDNVEQLARRLAQVGFLWHDENNVPQVVRSYIQQIADHLAPTVLHWLSVASLGAGARAFACSFEGGDFDIHAGHVEKAGINAVLDGRPLHARINTDWLRHMADAEDAAVPTGCVTAGADRPTECIHGFDLSEHCSRCVPNQVNPTRPWPRA